MNRCPNPNSHSAPPSANGLGRRSKPYNSPMCVGKNAGCTAGEKIVDASWSSLGVPFLAFAAFVRTVSRCRREPDDTDDDEAHRVVVVVAGTTLCMFHAIDACVSARASQDGAASSRESNGSKARVSPACVCVCFARSYNTNVKLKPAYYVSSAMGGSISVRGLNMEYLAMTMFPRAMSTGSSSPGAR